MSIERLQTVLTEAELPTTGRELAEILWLARHLPEPTESPERGTRDRPPGEAEPERAPESSSRPAARDRQPEQERRPAGTRYELHAPSASGEDGTDARGVLAPAAPMLGDVLQVQRALRPLKRRVPSRRRDVLDEEATAAFIADQPAASRHWIPVMAASPERWLDLALVIDTGPSMRVWRPLLRELRTALTQLGAFRDVRIWHLARTGTRLGVSTTPAKRQVQDPSALIDPSGRRVVLALSDCSGRHWWDGRAGHALHTWACHGPTAVLQPLPDRLWYRTAAPAMPGLAAPTRACAPGTALRFTPYEGAAPEGAVPVPVLGLTPDWLADWARLVAGAAGDGLATAVTYVTHGRRSGLAAVRRDSELPVEERVMLFQATASAAAVRLAAHVAVSAPSLPVMRLVQRALLPSSQPSDLAEVILSGLLRPTSADPDRYEFVDGARAALLAALPRSESWHAVDVLRRVSAQLEARAGSATQTFRALLPVPEGTGDLTLGAGTGPVALISPEALRLLGHTAIPTLSEQTPSGHTTRGQGQPAVQPVTRDAGPRREPRVRADPTSNTLPRVAPLVGRGREMESLLRGASAEVPALAIAITGMPGVGKTTLAVHLADRVAAQYPDGQLFLDLRAHRAGVAPLSRKEALTRLLTMLGGTRRTELPRDLEGLTRLWRAETADRRVLVVIDDAGSKRQLVPLFTNAPACLTVITSRRRSLMSVPHRSGIPRSGLNLPLDVLPLDDAVAMFTRIVGETHIRGDDDVAELVELCGRLPLAIRLVAGWASSSGRAEWPYPSHWSIAELTENLRAGRRSLSEVHVGGQSLWDAFDTSYRTLGESERRVFRRIGLHPTGEFETDAAAAIGDLRTVEEAEPLLETLTDAGLLDVVKVGRYRMHVLLHEFAHERLDVEDTSEERARAAGRLLDHYLHCALTAHRALMPYRPIADRVSQTSAWAPDLDLGAPQTALAWFDRERETLLACQDLATAYRRTHAWRIPRAIGHYLTSRGHIGDAEATYDEALRQAEEDWGGQAVADLTALSADVRHHQGTHTAAIELYRRARLRYVQLDDRLRAADMAVRIGSCHRLSGATEQARTEFEQALAVFTDLGDQYGQIEARRELEGVSGSAADPAAAVLRAPEVPEEARFCRNCRVPVGRGYGGRPGLLKGFCPQCGSAYSFTPELTPGDLVAGQYEAAGVVAHGGQGWVYLARDRNVSDRWVILKGLLDTDSAAMAATVAERRFLAEIDHPNIARVLNFVQYPVPATSTIRGYIVMEYVNGRSLFEILRRQRAEQGDSAALPLDYVLSCGIEILRALGYLHSRGLLYCDLKPENVIQSVDELKLIDLDAIRRMDDRDGPIYGTVGYQAPEVPADGPTISSDLYTVGRTLAVLSLPFAAPVPVPPEPAPAGTSAPPRAGPPKIPAPSRPGCHRVKRRRCSRGTRRTTSCSAAPPTPTRANGSATPTR